jgi:hypothetical protein
MTGGLVGGVVTMDMSRAKEEKDYQALSWAPRSSRLLQYPSSRRPVHLNIGFPTSNSQFIQHDPSQRKRIGELALGGTELDPS